MRDGSRAFLNALLGAPSVSGFEQPVQAVVREYAGAFAERIETDLHGNVTAVLHGDLTPRVQFAGHCDQIGFMVQHIEDSGLLRFSGVGGHDNQIVLGQSVVVYTKDGPIPGVVARKPTHLLSADDRKKIPELYQMWIDTGYGAEDVKAKVRIGDPISWRLDIIELGGGLLAAPAMDDKVGVYVCMEALRLLAEDAGNVRCGVYSVSTVQEEIGLRGAITSAYNVNPTVAVAADVTWATDHPDMNAAQTGEIKCGSGAVITRGPNINPVVFDLMVAAAEAEGIPYQIQAAPRGTGTDANAIQLSRGGVATGLISIPNRYMHSPVEVVSLEDLDCCARLLAAFTKRVTPEVDFTP
ncbi:MAG: M42 family metallopeptidase [Armatimonadetes bacterium]|nr:M42 family metallopeptidase [Armatimonadota bacterium]